MDISLLAFLMPVAALVLLFTGFPVAFVLGGTAIIFAALAGGLSATGLIANLPARIYGTVLTNETLVAVPLFILMGAILEESRVAGDMMRAMGQLLRRVRGGMALSVVLVGTLLAASTGIVGASVVALGMIALPALLNAGYDRRLACGTVAAAGTLGQVIPPSIVLIILGDQIASANSQAQSTLQQQAWAEGNTRFVPDAVSIGELFAGALVPGLCLAGLYAAYVLFRSRRMSPTQNSEPAGITEITSGLLPPFILIVVVLGSILGGIAPPSEAAGLGAAGALVLAMVRGHRTGGNLGGMLKPALDKTMRLTGMIFAIVIAAAAFSLVFRDLGGDEAIRQFLDSIPGGGHAALLTVMILIFFLGFFLDFVEICLIVVPVVAPILLLEPGIGPVWLGVLIAMNLQTSFLTPPFGFALFYLRGVAPPDLPTQDIYRGALPFVGLQIVAIGLVWVWPALAIWLPEVVFG